MEQKTARPILNLTIHPSKLEGDFLKKLREELEAKGGKLVSKWEPELIESLRKRACTPAQRAAVEALRTVHYLLPASDEQSRELLDRLKRQDAQFVLDIHEQPRFSGPSFVGALQAASIVTPEFPGSRQTHLDPSPNGINMRVAWQFVGGAGAHVHMYIMEGAWSRVHPEMTSLPLYDLDAASAADAANGIIPLAAVSEAPPVATSDDLDHGAKTLSTLFAPDLLPSESFSESSYATDSIFSGVNGLVPDVAKIAIGTQHDTNQSTVSGVMMARTIAAAIHSASTNPTVLLVERQIVGATAAGLGTAWSSVVKPIPSCVPYDSTLATYIDFICAVQFGVHVIMPMANGSDQTLDGTRWALDKVYDALASLYQAQFGVDPSTTQPIRVAAARRIGNEWKYNDSGINTGSNYAHHADTFGPVPVMCADRSAVTAFMETSAASAVIAGAAASILGRAHALSLSKTPDQLRHIFRRAANGQAVTDALHDQVVPSLARIYKNEFADRAPNLYFRRETVLRRWSPDIIIHPRPISGGVVPTTAQLNTLYGPGSGTEDDMIGPTTIHAGEQYAICVRVRNRSTTEAHKALVRIFSAPLAPISWHASWQYVGSCWLRRVHSGNEPIISPAVVWTAQQDGHASFVAEVTCGGDNPQPDRTSIATWADLVGLALRSENLAVRSAAFVWATLAEKSWIGEGLLSVFGLFSSHTPLAFEVESNVPKGSSIKFLAPPHFLAQGHEERWVTLELDNGRAILVDRSFVGSEKYELKFRVEIPLDANKEEYSLSLLQKREGVEVGRAALIFLDPRT